MRAQQVDKAESAAVIFVVALHRKRYVLQLFVEARVVHDVDGVFCGIRRIVMHHGFVDLVRVIPKQRLYAPRHLAVKRNLPQRAQRAAHIDGAR